MTARREQAREVFLQLEELPPGERAAALGRACGEDAELRAEVEALLRADEQAGRFLSSPTRHAAGPQEEAGASIGRYKLLEQIGEGGMGTIWMAEQREPVKRRVALKIIKLGMDTKQVIARFEAERQALALMDHPNIAKVFDAGATETGRPYFVMEYIRGVPILEYCDTERLDMRARLELFTSVCHAIQHAHQKGIIHRDIKPSNVLVTLHDGVPVPKVIDFGIAKATNSELTTKTLFTEHRQMIGTPAYMSPEQAEMSALDIDTRSDIYSLGVLLYELLTGTTPFDMEDLMSKGFGEMMRTIREVEPHKPSTRISSLGDTGTRTALQRKVDTKKLSSLLRGDVDWIVMKCLEKDRTRRYDTANGLASDIRRHLGDEPVTAGAPSAGYKLRKFAKRNRAQVIAASAVLTALLCAIVGTSWGLVEKSRARTANLQRQVEDEQRAAAESARLRRNAEAVTALLSQCEEALRAGDAAKAKVAIEAARKRSAEGGAEQDGQRLARLSADLDLVVELDAIDQFRWTWTNDGYPSSGVVAARMRAPLEKFGADPEMSSVEGALAAVEASAVRERIVAALDWQLWSRHSEAVRALLRRLDADPYRNEIRDTNLAQDTAKFVELTNRPAVLEQPPQFAAFLGEFNQVDPSRRVELLQAAAFRRPKDMNVLMALHRYSLQNMRERLRWAQAALAADPTNVAAYGNLGVALKENGQLDEAIACYHRALELSPDEAPAYLNLGNALELTGHFEEALVNFRKAIELAPTEFENYCCLGGTLSRHGRADEALASFQKSIELNPKHAEAHYGLGVVLFEQGRLPEALDSFHKVIEVDPKHAGAYGNIGVALRNQGRFDEAIGYFEKCLELEPKNAHVQTNLGGVLAELGRFDEAIAMCKQAVESDPKYAMAYYNLGRTYKQSSLEDAVANLEKAIELDPGYAEAHCTLAQALLEQGQREEALAEFKRGHELGSKRPDWKYPSADWIREAEAEIAKAARLEPKLSALLAGEYQPNDNDERLQFAYACQTKKLNHAATGLFTAVLAADPVIGDDLNGCVRYNAACVAALSAAGQGEDSASLGEEERARLRKQALDWLRADLDVATRKGSSANPADRGIVPTAMNNFLHQSDLVSIREPATLAKLPTDEQQAFTQLWADMAALLKQAETLRQAEIAAQRGEEALKEAAEALKRSRDTKGEEHPDTLTLTSELGNLLLARGKYVEAERVLARGVASCRRAFAGPHSMTAMLQHHHADALRALGRLDDALPEARAAMDMYRDNPGWASNEATHALSILLSILRAEGRPDEALDARREWFAVERRVLPPGSAEFASQLAALGLDLVKRGTLETAREAEPLLRECLEIRVKAIPESWLVPNAKSLLGGSLLGQQKLAEAEPLLLAGIRGLEEREASIPPQGATRIPEALERVVQFYEAQGDATQAAAWRSKLEARAAGGKR